MQSFRYSRNRELHSCCIGDTRAAGRGQRQDVDVTDCRINHEPKDFAFWCVTASLEIRVGQYGGERLRIVQHAAAADLTKAIEVVGDVERRGRVLGRTLPPERINSESGQHGGGRRLRLAPASAKLHHGHLDLPDATLRG